jgi:hypothetical protein
MHPPGPKFDHGGRGVRVSKKVTKIQTAIPFERRLLSPATALLQNNEVYLIGRYVSTSQNLK